MSQRTLVELNHDFCPPDDGLKLLDWAEDMRAYMCSGDPNELPDGVTFKNRRHHSEPEPASSAQGDLELLRKCRLYVARQMYVAGTAELLIELDAAIAEREKRV